MPSLQERHPCGEARQPEFEIGEAMSILVTGGTGYIGSHTCVELIQAGYDVVILDDLSNSKAEVVDKIEKITGTRPVFYETTMMDLEGVRQIFRENRIDAVIHFAGFKAVGESVAKPLMYYSNNITGTLHILQAMEEADCREIVFSSSATVYGCNNPIPYVEGMPTSATSPYGYTKVMIEQILTDMHTADSRWKVSLLRYFNPIGAHDSGLIGENPNGIPNNLMPYITQVGAGKLEKLGVFGDDYPTHDGTGVRDYIHVVDLAKGHLKAIEKLDRTEGGTVDIYNLGTGVGYSVLDVVKAFEKANGVKIPYEIKPRRAGDIAEFYANAEKAHRELGWQAERSLEDMCRTSWNFIQKSQAE